MGRPRINGTTKMKYQHIPIDVQTYERFVEVVEKVRAEAIMGAQKRLTYSDIQNLALDALEEKLKI